jgi:hypothetical protein
MKVKDTFIIRSEWYDSISKLTANEQATIFKNLFEYHLGRPQNVDLSTLSLQLVWGLIEPNLKRNIENYDRRCETSAENGKLGGRPPKDGKPKKPISKPNYPIETLNDSDSDTVSDTDNENEISFEVFWDAYDKKVGEKRKLEKKWNSLSKEDRRAAIAYIPAYKQSQPDKKYRKNPETFLNNHAWHDEIVGATPVVAMQEQPRKSTYDPYDRKNYYNEADYQAALKRLNAYAS